MMASMPANCLNSLLRAAAAQLGGRAGQFAIIQYHEFDSSLVLCFSLYLSPSQRKRNNLACSTIIFLIKCCNNLAPIMPCVSRYMYFPRVTIQSSTMHRSA